MGAPVSSNSTPMLDDGPSPHSTGTSPRASRTSLMVKMSACTSDLSSCLSMDMDSWMARLELKSNLASISGKPSNGKSRSLTWADSQSHSGMMVLRQKSPFHSWTFAYLLCVSAYNMGGGTPNAHAASCTVQFREARYSMSFCVRPNVFTSTPGPAALEPGTSKGLCAFFAPVNFCSNRL